eukprot:jgi/Ulvmu1/2048/UM120_0044.1
MFDVELDDIELGAQRKPVQWAVRVESATSRSALKQERVEARYGSAAAGRSPGSSDSDGRKKSSRAERAQERRVRSEQPGDRGAHKHEPRDPSITWLPQEVEEGNCEYKLRLRDPSCARLEQLITQMKFRMSEGSGECFYYVGVEDGGYPRGLSDNDMRLSLNNLHYMAEALTATASVARLFQGAGDRCCALVRVQDGCVEAVSYLEMRVAVGGSVGSGKSSLVAVLCHGAGGRPALDDGRGRARTSVLRHRHEIQSGHTSSISQCTLGYDGGGGVLNYASVAAPTAAELSTTAHKLLHFIDLCGHSRFFKTALYGMTSLLPDCQMLCVCARAGVDRTTQEHLAAALALDVPVFAVITQADTVPADGLHATVQATRALLATAADTAILARSTLTEHSTDDASDADVAPAEADEHTHNDDMFAIDDDQAAERRLARRVPLVASEAKAAAVAQLMCIIQQHHHPLQCRSYIVPCFVTSATTGAGIMLLHRFLARLQQAPRRKQPEEVRRRRHILESFSGRLAPGVSDHASWPQPHIGPAPPNGPHDSGQPLGPPGSAKLLDPGSGGHSAEVVDAHSERRRGAADALAVDEDGAELPRALQTMPTGDMVHFQVDHVFEVHRVGTVLSGTTVRGCIDLGATLWWGPQDSAGEFVLVAVRGIHRSRVPVAKVLAGECATIAIEQLPPASRPPSGPASPAAASAAAGEAAARPASPQRGAAAAAARPASPLVRTSSACSSPRSDAALGNSGRVTGTAQHSTAATEMQRSSIGAAGDLAASAQPSSPGADSGSATPPRGKPKGGSGTASPAAEPAFISFLPRDPGDSNADTPAFGSPAQTQATSVPLAQEATAEPGGTLSQLSKVISTGGTAWRPDGVASAPLPGMRGPQRSAALPAGLAPLHDQPPLSGEALARLSASLSESQMQISATPPDASGECSWHHVGLQLAGLAIDGDPVTAGRGRKGTVLLDQRMQPRATMEMSAVLILTNGQWPPRGLVSGRWPPGGTLADHDGGDAGEGSTPQRAGRAGERSSEDGGRRARSRKARYRHMVYCAATRQAAEVLAMREVQVDLERARYEVEGVNLSAAAAAAAVLVGGRDVDEDGGHDGGADERIGAVVDVRFKFLQRAEFLVPGMRVIVRDHAGNVSAVGVVRWVPSCG